MRGRDWYVLEDTLSGRHHRYPAEAHPIIRCFDGRRTLDEIYREAEAELGDRTPTQDQTIDLLARLDGAELLRRAETHAGDELSERFQKQRTKRRKERTNPLAIRIPLVDPDALLVRLLPIARVVCRPLPMLAAAALIAFAAVAAMMHWQDLTHATSERILAAENLPALVLAYLLLKLFHELGHGLVARYFGGAVHEAGVMLLALFPMPYVDASASAVFPSRRKRVAVAAAGIAVEVLISSAALFLWLSLEPGGLRTFAWQLVWLGAASTVVFNANPLLRYDGYYVLTDLIGIPNLGQRSSRYWVYLAKRWILQLRESESPADAPDEEGWLAAYGLLSFLYRISILTAIAIIVGEVWVTAGVLLVLYFGVQQFGLPAARVVRYLATSPELMHRRTRAVTTAAAVAGGLITLVCVFPVPNMTRAEGVVWAPPGREIRVNTDGFVRFFQRLDGSKVEKFETVIETEDPLLTARLTVAQAELRVLHAERSAALQSDPLRVRQIDDEIEAAEEKLRRVEKDVASLSVKSPESGNLVLPGSRDLSGRLLRKGDVIGFVTDENTPTVRVVVSQDEIAMVRERADRIRVRFATDLSETYDAALKREVPAASYRLPTRALGSEGGGRFPVDPDDPDALQTLDRVFQLDLVLAISPAHAEIGSRVYVLFDHGREALAVRVARGLRRLLLDRLGV